MRISVLDQSPIAAGSSGPEAISHTLQLAQLAERLGYSRYLVAEHHGSPMLAGAAPEILIGAIAAATDRIRVGSAGVMLTHYSPFKVAEQFSLLAALYPDRIDLGIGRAPGTDPLTTYALQRDRNRPGVDDFPNQFSELLGYFRDGLPAEHPFSRLITSLPGATSVPELWLLGSSRQSSTWAASLGLPYSFADFINPTGAAIAANYRRTFAASASLNTPHLAVAVSAICAEDEADAIRLAASQRMSMYQLRRGTSIPVPEPEEAIRFLKSVGEDPEQISDAGRRVIVGTPDQVRAGLEAVASEYQADELVIVTITHDHTARMHSHELIAAAFGLDAAR